MKKLCYVTLALALTLAGCKPEASEFLTPEIKIADEVPVIPAEGGTVKVLFEIINPVEDATASVHVQEGTQWLIPVSANDGTAILEASANNTDTVRSTEITVSYTWDGGEVSVNAVLAQEGDSSVTGDDDAIEAITAIGVYYGNSFSSDAANYYFMLSDCEFDDGTVKSGPGFMLYFDCYGERSGTPQNAKLPSGRYEFVNENAYGHFQISKESTVFMELDAEGMIISNIYPVSGYLDIEYAEGSGYSMTGSFITEDNEEIKVSYAGDFTMSNQSGVFGEDISITAEYSYDAVYYGDLYGSGACEYYFMIGTMEPDTDGGTPRGSGYYFDIDLWGAESDDPDYAVIPEGTYRYSGSIDMNTAYSDMTLGHCVIPDGSSRYAIPYTDGTVTVRHTLEGYEISCEFTLKDGYTMSVNYSGPLSFENQAPAESGDLDINFATGKGIYFGDIYGAGTANYTLEFLDQEGTTALTIDVNDILDDDMVLSEGTYTVDEDGSMEAGKFYTGIIDIFGVIGTYVTLGYGSDNPEYLLITGGSFDVKHVEEGYRFTFDFLTQGGSKVQGSYEGVFPIE